MYVSRKIRDEKVSNKWTMPIINPLTNSYLGLQLQKYFYNVRNFMRIH